MMKINKRATAGTLESSDVMVTVEPTVENAIQIKLSSVVEKQFGGHIRQVIVETAQKHGVKQAVITVNDRGALDCTIAARVATAIYRGAECAQSEWEAKK
jgi:citrate lyase subunit gamma (acyl carrier protein)